MSISDKSPIDSCTDCSADFNAPTAEMSVVSFDSLRVIRDSKGALSAPTSASTTSETAKPEPIPVNDRIIIPLEFNLLTLTSEYQLKKYNN